MALKIGIECNNLEGEKFGVGHTLLQLLKSLSENSGAKEDFRFVLYFKKEIPTDRALQNPIFENKILKIPFLPSSFNVFYHILLPIAYFRDGLDGLFLPSYMLPAFFIGKAATVLTNDVYFEAHSGTLPFRYRVSYIIFCWLAAKRSKKILTISNFAKKEIARLYKIPASKIDVIPWGLNEELYKLEKTPENIKMAEETAKKLGVQKDFILSVGQAFPRRKIKESMLAFEILCKTDAKQMENIQYVVACVDKYNPPIIDNLAKEINGRLKRQAIIRTNYIPQKDIIYLFNSAKLLVYISESEALGLPPIEALKCGSVPLVADNELTRDIFQNDAFFVKNTDSPESIATEMKDALSNTQKREQIINSGNQMPKKFSWKKYGGELLDFFEETFTK